MEQSDRIFKAFIRVTLETLKELYEKYPDNKLKGLIDDFQKTLED